MYKNNMKKRLMPVLLVFAMLLSLFAPMAQEKVVAEDSIGSYGSQAYDHIEHLSEGLGGARTAGSEYEEVAAQYIKDEFQSYGYQTSVEDFTYKNRKDETFESQNVIAVKEGSSEKEVILAAHMDQVTTGGSKGVQDNGSGVGVMLEVAERLKDVDTDYTIKFLSFGAEEVGLKGSQAYVKDMTKEEINNTIAMINLDSVIAGDYMYVYAGSNKKGFVRDHALNISDELGLDLITQTGLNPNYEAGITGDWSDHAPFNEKEYQ